MSKIYREFARTTVKYKRVFARFASQGVIAGTIFDQYDRDRSGKLGPNEIALMLKGIFHEMVRNQLIEQATPCSGNSRDNKPKHMLRVNRHIIMAGSTRLIQLLE